MDRLCSLHQHVIVSVECVWPKIVENLLGTKLSKMRLAQNCLKCNMPQNCLKSVWPKIVKNVTGLKLSKKC